MANTGWAAFFSAMMATGSVSAPPPATAPIGAPSAALSVDKDLAAKQSFSQLHFFSGGRGMHLSPNLITYYNFFAADGKGTVSGALQRKMKDRWGLVFDDGQLRGLFDVNYKGLRVGVVGCVVCHGGKAAGQYVVGLGNKNIDVVRMARDVHRMESWWATLVPGFMKSQEYGDLEESALGFSRYLGDERIGNLTQGLVPVSFIRGWFYRVHGERIPSSLTRGQVKVPHLWGYGLKRKAGQFCDGYGNGEKAGWAAAVELAAGQKHQNVRAYYERVESAELLFNEFLPPRYPFFVGSVASARGKALFEKTCARCHGLYARDSQGFPIYDEPKWIPWEVVRTDSDRIDGNTAAFNEQVRKSPLSDLIEFKHTGRGYFAPRLEGIWARFPYLHNGSVPSVRALLTSPAARPKAFSLRDAAERARFSERDLGLTQDASAVELAKRTSAGERDVYDTSRVGHSNQGHDFYTDMSDVEKSDLIEYIKTL